MPARGVPAAGELVFVIVAAALIRWHAARRRELLMRACHEIRGPLTAAGLALHRLGRSDPTAARTSRALALELARAARALADLDGSATEEPVTVDLHAAVGLQMEVWREVAAARGVTLRFRPGQGAAAVRADAVRLAQAVGNLVANAIEHGGGEIEVSTSARAGRALIVVSNAGVAGRPWPTGAPELGRPSFARVAGARGNGLKIAAAIAGAAAGQLVAGRGDGPGASGRGGARIGSRAWVALNLPLVAP